MGSGKYPGILIVDDEAGILRGLSGLFRREGFRVYAEEDFNGALAVVDSYNLDAAIIDIRLKNDRLGTDLLEELKKSDPDLPVIMITGFGSLESAVDALRRGASDYILKPIDNAHILETVKKNIDLVRLRKDNLFLRGELRTNLYAYDIITEDKDFLALIDTADRVKDSPAAILLSGESGTGKEILARYIHFTSNRKEGPFVCVNCAALSESLLLSELFGHERGSFTGAVEKRLGKFELADKGTLFLDEIGDMSLDVQAKLLRVLEDSSFERVGGSRKVSVDIRIITATNKNIPGLITSGKFRADLFYRINIVSLELPPLRKRPRDIPLLVEHFMDKYNKRYNKKVTGVRENVMAAWKAYEWPGNIRELQNIINQAVLLSKGPLIASTGICSFPREAGIEESERYDSGINSSLGEYTRKITARYEKEAIEQTLRENYYNRTKTSQALRITRKTLSRKIEDLGIRIPK